MSSSPQDTAPAQLEPRRTSRTSKSHKPPNVQAAVMTQYALGQTKTKIAKDLGIARNTIYSILEGNETERIVLEGRSRAIGYIHKSLDVVENRLNKNDGSIAISLLRGTNVLQNQALTANQTNIVANTWITMRAQKQAELGQAIEVQPESAGETTISSVSTPEQTSHKS